MLLNDKKEIAKKYWREEEKRNAFIKAYEKFIKKNKLPSKEFGWNPPEEFYKWLRGDL